jgi:hypothetical protein
MYLVAFRNRKRAEIDGPTGYGLVAGTPSRVHHFTQRA